MPTQRFEPSAGPTDRIDPKVQREVIALAARLQEADSEVLSVDELQRMAAEAGVQAKYVQQALKQLTPAPQTQRSDAQPRHTEATRATSLSPWFWGISLLLTQLVIGTTSHGYGRVIPEAALIVFLASYSRNRFAGATVGLLVGLFATQGWRMYNYGASPLGPLVMACLWGLVWGWGAEKFSGLVSRPPEPQKPDRVAKLEQLAQLKQELESQKVHRAFLSVDIVGSRELRERIGELDAEGLFVRYHKWLEKTVTTYGGKVQVAAGDGAMAIFPSGESAVKASRLLLSEVNGLSPQLRIRLGVSQGLVPDGPIGYIHSSVPDRAATLQRAAPANCLAVDQECVADSASIFGAIHALADSPGVFVSQI